MKTLTIGNLSLPLLLAAWGSPLCPPDPLQAHAEERARMIADAVSLGAGGIEDMLGWGVVEPERDRWDWSEYRRNAELIRAAGLDYICFAWLMILPRWVRDDPSVPRARCLEHGEEVDYFSIFSDWCLEAYERFYARLATEMGDDIAALRVASPYDFGETAYPAGPAAQLFPLRHVHLGYWAAEPDARRHLAGWLEDRYTNLAALNSAWETAFTGFDQGAAAAAPTGELQRLDFIEWYHQAYTERMAELIRIARRHFPHTRILVNLGWPYEKPEVGQDIPGLIEMGSREGVEVRTPVGSVVPFAYTCRVRGAASRTGAVRSSEPPDINAPAEVVALRLFKDASLDLTRYFEYVGSLRNFLDGGGDWRHVGAGRPIVRVAVIYSRSAYWLDASWDRNPAQDASSTTGGYPHGLLSFTEALRAAVDYDVLDERQVAAGALAGYEVAVWPLGFAVRDRRTLTQLAQWLAAGGCLVSGSDTVRVVDEDGSVQLSSLAGRDRVVVLSPFRPTLDPRRELDSVNGAYDPERSGLDLSVWVSAILAHLEPRCNAGYTVLTERRMLATETEDGWLVMPYGAGVAVGPRRISAMEVHGA